MSRCDRRAFLGRMGSGMLASAVGLGLISELEVHGLLSAESAGRLEFGTLEPLASLMQETPPADLMPRLATALKEGTSLQAMVTAAALANARTFGGQDYNGYHAFMAMVPSLAMSAQLSGRQAALPVFKVLYRNAVFTQDHGGIRGEILQPVHGEEAGKGDPRASLLADGRSGEFDRAETTLAALAQKGPEAAFASLQPLIRDNIDVHQVVLAYRSWDMQQLAGPANGQVLLRQTMRQCIDRDDRRRRQGRDAPAIRKLLPQLMESRGLNGEMEAPRKLTGAELEELAQIIFTASREDAASAMAAHLSQGSRVEDLGQALSLAAVRLLLHDPGRRSGSPGKPEGSVHGASVGLHAADSADAWRGIAAATRGADRQAALITAAWHTAGQARGMDTARPHHADARAEVADLPAGKIPGALEESLRSGDQKRACALAERFGSEGGSPETLQAMLIRPAIEFDGALHHEKYFHTATTEFQRTAAAWQWQHLVALTRVMASGYGFPAAGLPAAREALAGLV